VWQRPSGGPNFAKKWTAIQSSVAVQTVPAAGGLCTASVLVESKTTGLSNPLLNALWGAILQQAPTPLDIN
jgi:hypothetical protein